MVQQNVHPIFVSMSTRVDPLVADDMARKVLTINIVSAFYKIQLKFLKIRFLGQGTGRLHMQPLPAPMAHKIPAVPQINPPPPMQPQ